MRSGGIGRAAARLAELGGLIGPAGFIAAWVVGGQRVPGYSPTEDAISRLAADGASTRVLMTAGFACFGLAVPAFALARRDVLGGPAAIAAVACGVATFGIAATPLETSSQIDRLHAVAASATYGALVAIPLLARSPLARRGHRMLAAAARPAAAVSGACLAATTLGRRAGLLQRVGLTTTDMWLALVCVAAATRPRLSPVSQPARAPTRR